MHILPDADRTNADLGQYRYDRGRRGRVHTIHRSDDVDLSCQMKRHFMDVLPRAGGRVVMSDIQEAVSA